LDAFMDSSDRHHATPPGSEWVVDLGTRRIMRRQQLWQKAAGQHVQAPQPMLLLGPARESAAHDVAAD
jgi:hypothetical protein